MARASDPDAGAVVVLGPECEGRRGMPATAHHELCMDVSSAGIGEPRAREPVTEGR